MSSTTIHYRNAEFVANDLPIEVWLLEVVKQIDVGVAPWLDKLREEWHLQATSGFGFGPSPGLDEFVTSDDQRRVLASVFLRAIEALSTRSDPFTPDELIHWGVGGAEATYSIELPTQMVMDVGRQFHALLSNASFIS